MIKTVYYNAYLKFANANKAEYHRGVYDFMTVIRCSLMKTGFTQKARA